MMRYDRKKGSKRDQGIATPSNPKGAAHKNLFKPRMRGETLGDYIYAGQIESLEDAARKGFLR